MSFHVRVDPGNPGQFFACCGLFELAFRLKGDAAARFEGTRFVVEAGCALGDVVGPLSRIALQQLDPEDNTASPIGLPAPFGLVIDWWKDEASGGRDLKVWAGRMESVRIAQAMVAALQEKPFADDLLNEGCVVYEPGGTKKVEPFYFDSRRAQNAHSRDIGFSPNDLSLTTTAFPAVEALCLIGLQRFRPAPTEQRRIYEYRAWAGALPIAVAPAVVAGAIPSFGSRTYRFENWYRTGQKKHKAFRPAVLIAKGE